MLTGRTYAVPRYGIGMILPTFEGQIDYAPMWAGTSVTDVGEVKPAAEIVRELIRETALTLAR